MNRDPALVRAEADHGAPLLVNDGALAECPLCVELVPAAEVQVRRMHTSYAEEGRNFDQMCTRCHAWVNEGWDDMWADYYASRL